MTFHKIDIAHSFSVAASAYDQHSFIQKEIGKRLIQRLSFLKKPPAAILDVGAGTGFLTRQLQQQFPMSYIVGLDLAQGMTHYAKSKQSWQPWKRQPSYISGDTEMLPFRQGSFDLIFSNFTLQWCLNLPEVFQEFKRVLKPEGMLFFSTLGPQTLHELRTSWASTTQYTHVNEFVDMHDIGDHLLQTQFADPVIDMDLMTVRYGEVKQLLNDLKATGAHNINLSRPKGCMTKRYFEQMLKAYEKFRQPDGLYPATFEIIYGHACQSQKRFHGQDSDGLIRIPGDKIPLLQTS